MDQVHVRQRGSRRRQLARRAFESREDFGNAIFSLPLITDRITSFQPRAAIPGCFSAPTPGPGSAAITSCNSVGSCSRFVSIHTTSPVAFRKLHSDSASRRPRAVQLTAAQFPGGISAIDLASANSWLAFLSGTVSSVAQTFNVRDRTPASWRGFPVTPITAWTTVRILPGQLAVEAKLTLRGGLKWEYHSPLGEEDNLAFLPTLDGRSVRDALLDPDGRVTFVNGDFYGRIWTTSGRRSVSPGTRSGTAARPCAAGIR